MTDDLATSMSGSDDHYQDFTWRVGRKVGRTIYAIVGPDMANDTDVLIGVMDTPELAAEAVRSHNERQRSEGDRVLRP